MNRSRLICLMIPMAALLLASAGCSYFNTFYNIKKKFREAESDYNRRQTPPPSSQPATPAQPPGQGGAQGRPGQQGVPIDKYRKVIEISAKLLDYYPKSRWVDDTLLLMGISYYRLQDYSRAERKFTELITIFPKSEHVPQAVIWKARALVEQGKHEDAAKLLNESSVGVKDRRQRGQIEFLLAKTEFDQNHFDEAVTHYEQAKELLPAGDERLDAVYGYGLGQFERGYFREAADAFADVARATRNRQRAFDAYIYSARAALAAGEISRAEDILNKVKKNSAFSTFIGEVDLELANLSVETGRVDQGLEFYHKYLDEHPTGEKRGVAFFRLANVYRRHRLDLSLAKSMLDSAIQAASGREITDSARAMQEEMTKGLTAIAQFKALQDSVRLLETESQVIPQQPGEVLPPASTPVIPETEDSSNAAPTGTVPDTALIADSARTRLITPPDADSTGADSLVGFTVTDTSKHEPGKQGAVTSESDTVKSTPLDTVRSAHDQHEERLARARSRYQLAALRVAEFYQLSLQEHDSALAYYRIAAASPYNKAVYWKANLYLGSDAAQDSGREAEANRYYQAVIDADSVPIDAANVARQAIGLPLLEVAPSPQIEAFRAAEQLKLSGQVPADSIVGLFGNVVTYDSTSKEGMSSMLVQMDLYENVLLKPDSAKLIAERLIALFPDSSFANNLRVRIMPPDTVGSVFSMTDEELMKTAQPQGTVIEETPTEGGWPPPEETLRGRRFE